VAELDREGVAALQNIYGLNLSGSALDFHIIMLPDQPYL